MCCSQQGTHSANVPISGVAAHYLLLEKCCTHQAGKEVISCSSRGDAQRNFWLWGKSRLAS